MSDDWIKFILVDPTYISNTDKQEKAESCLKEIVPDTNKVSTETYNFIRFVDCGANFEYIKYSNCGEKVPIRWWQDAMDRDYQAGKTIR